jgi:hypothetical protein
MERAFFDRFVRPGLELLESLGGPVAGNPLANQMLLTIAQQESGLSSRVQIIARSGRGPAHGWFQFEKLGGCAGVLAHPTTAKLARALCRDQIVYPSAEAVWEAIEGNDLLAAGFARLLLWTDPKLLPVSMEDGWAYYLRNWRPGKPHKDKWPVYWHRSLEAFKT